MTRDLVVRIRADASNFRTQMRTAQNSLTTFGKNVETSDSKSKAFLKTWGVTAGIAVAAGAATMVKAAADFDEGMSMVKATGADAARNIDDLRAAAVRAGADTKFSATEAAGGVEALLKANVSAADVMSGGLKGALDLAAAGNLDVAGSAEAAASAMNQFGLSGRDVPHIADLLAAGAGKAQGEVSDMAAALNQAGLVANGFGFTIEETTGVLAEFASAGLVGSDAGTSLRTLLIRMAAPTDTAAAAMKKYGIQTRDANGELLNAAQIAGQLQRAFKGRSDAERDAAFATIFGQDAIRGANILYKDGAEKAQQWTQAVDDAGFAADNAATKMDNLKGDLEKLKGALETELIKGGAGSQGPLRTFTQETTEAVTGIGKIGDAWDRLLKKVNADNVFKTGGESKGLFSSIKEFMQAQRAKDASGLDFETVIKFRTEGAPRAIAETAKVAQQANATPRQVRTALRLQGWSTRGIDAVVRAMRQVDRKQVRAQLRLQGFTTAEIDAVLAGLQDVDKTNIKPKKITLTAAQAESEIANVLGGFGDIEAEEPNPTVTVNDQASGPIGDIQSSINSLKDKTITITTVRKTVREGPYLGGRVSEWAGQMGFAFGGKVPGTPPIEPDVDNVFARDERGRALAVRSGEWIINERASRLNDRYLAAINAGADMNKLLPGFAAGRLGSVAGSSPQTFMARLADPTVAVRKDGLLELIDDRVLVTFGAVDHQKRQAQSRRKA